MKRLAKCFKGLQSPWVLLQQERRFLAGFPPSHYEAISRGEQEMPKYFNFASDVVDKWCQEEKNGTRAQNSAFWWVNSQSKEVMWSFEELSILSRKTANILSGPCGLQKGDRLMAVLPRIPEWWLLILACIQTGVVFIPGTLQLTAKDISYRLQASKAKCIVVSDTLSLAVDSITPECKFMKSKLLVSDRSRDGWLNFSDLFQVLDFFEELQMLLFNSNCEGLRMSHINGSTSIPIYLFFRAAPDDHNCVKTRSEEPMLIYFTSGSTGSPKMVEHSHGSYGIGFASSSRHWMGLSPSSVFWNTSDPGWVKTAWSSLFAPWIHGSCVFVHHLPQFEPTVILNTLAKYPITNFCTAPTAYRMLVQHNVTSYKFRSLKHCVTGGEPLNPEVFEQWKIQTGLEIYEGYGQTETVTICANVKGMKIKPGSMGKASPPYDVQIVDEQGNIQPPGKEGDVAIRIKPKRPFCLFLKYTDNPEKTAATERGSFYITGDRGVKDEEGYIWFVGRADDVINSAGYRIGPFEVESALIEHPAVVESAVVSSPDPTRGEVVKAFVVLSPAFNSYNPETLIRELQDHVKNSTAPYKYPRKIEFVQALPKTAAGKIQRNVLRKQEWGVLQHSIHR